LAFPALWSEVLVILKPKTVVGRRRTGVRLYWRRRSRSPIPVWTGADQRANPGSPSNAWRSRIGVGRAADPCVASHGSSTLNSINSVLRRCVSLTQRICNRWSAPPRPARLLFAHFSGRHSGDFNSHHINGIEIGQRATPAFFRLAVRLVDNKLSVNGIPALSVLTAGSLSSDKQPKLLILSGGQRRNRTADASLFRAAYR